MATDGDFHPVLAAEKILATALTDAGVSTDVDTITTAPVQGQPAEVLIEMAQTCELLVVGSRRHGKVLGALLGSISHYLAGHAPCLIVVVKPPAHPGHRRHER
ncbi:MAG: universal stress protein [Pseudonocardia sp.]|uniref:universal stress protein n=1 Tax=Pseudonocardia sp. TaxID=60912 RepID=UPI001AD3271B|nr:universal stress protein [Pseudonocardia sp.]MBN9102759.1 universal stress protein [Pseudonocardia sp.]